MRYKFTIQPNIDPIFSLWSFDTTQPDWIESAAQSMIASPYILSHSPKNRVNIKFILPKGYYKKPLHTIMTIIQKGIGYEQVPSHVSNWIYLFYEFQSSSCRDKINLSNKYQHIVFLDTPVDKQWEYIESVMQKTYVDFSEFLR